MMQALLLSIALSGQIEPITAHETVLTESPAMIRVVAEADDYTWFLPAGVTVVEDTGSTLKFTASPGTYQLRCKTLTIDWDAKQLNPVTYVATFIIGRSPGPDPGPGPTTCDDVPDDKWSIGKTACIAGQQIPSTAKSVASEFVAVYEDLAGKVERFELKIPSEVSAALSTATRPILEPLPQSDRNAWTLTWSMAIKNQMANYPQPGMGDLPAYYRAVANGLKAVK